MDLWPLIALWVTNYEAHLADILPENTLMYSYYIAKNQGFMLRIKLCLRLINTPLRDFLLHFSHILPCNLELVILMSLKLF